MAFEFMLDLEWMGKPPTAAIVAIGVAVIDRDKLEVVDNFYAPIDLDSSVSMGGTLHPDTIRWWLRQPDEARNGVGCGRQLGEALKDLGKLFYKYEPEAVWGYGASSDNVTLRHAYEQWGGPTPDLFNFRTDRCLRTKIADMGVVPWVNYGTPHNARDDAMAQALTLIEIYKQEM